MGPQKVLPQGIVQYVDGGEQFTAAHGGNCACKVYDCVVADGRS